MGSKVEVTGIPQIGEIKGGKEIGYANRSKYIWHACEKCGRGRWVPFAGGNKKEPPRWAV